MKLLVFTNARDLPNEHELINAMLRDGLEVLHVRKPAYSEEEMLQYLLRIGSEHYKKIVLHSHHALTLKLKLGGIHLTERHLEKWGSSLDSYLAPFLKSELRVSVSLHKLDQLSDASSIYDYIFLSPVFKSISKQDYGPRFNLPEVIEALETAYCKVIALGGIDHTKIGLCRKTGFHGAGVLGAIWLSQEPFEEFKRIRNLCLQPQPYLV